MIASGFECWGAVCSADAERWIALGTLKNESALHSLQSGARTLALAAADDFLKMNESGDARQN